MDSGVGLTVCGTACSFHFKMKKEKEMGPYKRIPFHKLLLKMAKENWMLFTIGIIKTIFVELTVRRLFFYLFYIIIQTNINILNK